LRLLAGTLKTAGKSALIVVGAGFGLLRGLRVLIPAPKPSSLETLEARVDTIHVALARLADRADELQGKLDHRITKEELAQHLDSVLGRLERGVDARFEHQTRSVEALRVMVGQTDELLQRVLDGLESIKAGNGEREWEVKPAGR
jgi:hypothetical protein